MQDIAVIVTTLRRPDVISDYLANASGHDFNLGRLFVILVTEDSIDRSEAKSALRDYGVEGEIFGQSDRDAWFAVRNLSSYERLIPRRSHAETSFGLLAMYEKPSLRYGVFIDDDTRPLDSTDYFGDHLKRLEYAGSALELESNLGWVNVLHDSFQRHGLYPRGYPYGKIGEQKAWRRIEVQTGDVVLNQGLWTNVPDLDAVRILSLGGLNGLSPIRLSPRDYGEDFTVRSENFITVCSMNLAFRREVIPAFYQFPMDENHWGIGRFDDIWSGVVLKHVIDAEGKRMLSGKPLCVHDKFPRSTFKDLTAEAPGLEINETFSRMVQSAHIERGLGYHESTRRIASVLRSEPSHPFVQYCGEFLAAWVDLITQLD